MSFYFREKMEKNVFFFLSFSFIRGTYLLPREAQPCLLEMKKNKFFLSQEARLCLSETKKNIIFSFGERHGFASARGTILLLQKSRQCFTCRNLVCGSDLWKKCLLISDFVFQFDAFCTKYLIVRTNSIKLAIELGRAI